MCKPPCEPAIRLNTVMTDWFGDLGAIEVPTSPSQQSAARKDSFLKYSSTRSRIGSMATLKNSNISALPIDRSFRPNCPKVASDETFLSPIAGITFDQKGASALAKVVSIDR